LDDADVEADFDAETDTDVGPVVPAALVIVSESVFSEFRIKNENSMKKMISTAPKAQTALI
jgi:hypothetical protein